jgi:putative redox protein
MILELQRIEAPFVFALSNEAGATSLIDASEQIGGKNKGLRPMEMLAGSLASCAAIDVLLMLEKQREDCTAFSVRITAVRSEEVPARFTHIALEFTCSPQILRTRLERNIELALEKYCSVAASLHPEIEITYTVKNHETPGN